MTLLENQPTNVKGLVLIEPQKGTDPLFDPARDITQEQWIKARELISDLPVDLRVSVMGIYTFLYKLTTRNSRVFPTKDVNDLKNYILAKDYSTNLVGYMEALSYLRLISPKKANEVRGSKRISASAVGELLPDWDTTLNEYCRFRLAFPEYDLGVPLNQISNEESFFNSAKNHFYDSGTSDIDAMPLAGSMFIFLANLKFLAPSIYSKITINEDVWETAKRQLDGLLEDDDWNRTPFERVYSFLDLAMRMTLVSAEKVTIDRNGINITRHPSPLATSMPDIPKFLKF